MGIQILKVWNVHPIVNVFNVHPVIVMMVRIAVGFDYVFERRKSI
jgi:hypothetical protein